MPQPTETTDHAGGAPAAPGAEPGPLPRLRTALSDDEIVSRLMALAKRGKLAGFEPRPEPGVLFRCDAQGTPWDKDLLGTIDASGATGTGTDNDAGRTLDLSMRLRPRMPIIFAAVLAFTVWPGVVLTDSLLATWFGFYNNWSVRLPWLTYAWYLPLTLLPIPWMWKGWSRKTDASTLDHAHEQAAKIAAALGAEPQSTN